MTWRDAESSGGPETRRRPEGAPVFKKPDTQLESLERPVGSGFMPCLDAVKAKRKFFVNHLYGVLNVVKK